MRVSVRPAKNSDALEMAEILNEIIEIGGTTAYTSAVTPEYLASRMNEAPEVSAWHVALDIADQCVGFQWITSAGYLPKEACEIATFAKVGRTGLGIGSALFDATHKAAKELGYDWINANMRADNESGLTYYNSRGFKDYSRQEGVQLANGLVIDKILKRLDLT